MNSPEALESGAEPLIGFSSCQPGQFITGNGTCATPAVMPIGTARSIVDVTPVKECACETGAALAALLGIVAIFIAIRSRRNFKQSIEKYTQARAMYERYLDELGQ